MEKIPLCCYLLPRENRGYTKCYPLLSIGTLHQSRKKFLIRNFTGVLILNFITDWESEIVNQSCLGQIRRKIDVIGQK